MKTIVGVLFLFVLEISAERHGFARKWISSQSLHNRGRRPSSGLSNSGSQSGSSNNVHSGFQSQTKPRFGSSQSRPEFTQNRPPFRAGQGRPQFSPSQQQSRFRSSSSSSSSSSNNQNLFASEARFWTSSGLDGRVPEIPEKPLFVLYPDQFRTINTSVTTDKLLEVPTIHFPDTCNSGADDLYTFLIVDVDIVRPDDPDTNSFIHYASINIPGRGPTCSVPRSAKSLNPKDGDEVFPLIPPFTFHYTPETGLVRRADASIHSMVYLVFKQPGGRATFDAPPETCSRDGVFARLGEYMSLFVEKQSLIGPIAGSFLEVPYSFEATDRWLCELSKCTGIEFPGPLPGINDTPDCNF